jgi:NADPH-dependent ferric siderophore reductase
MSVNELDPISAAKPVFNRQKLEPIRRNLTVMEVCFLTPQMIRVTLGGDDLAGFRSPSPDDHIKVFFPAPDGEGEKRDYTPRSFNAEARTLAIDFALHEGGVASGWAQKAQPGDQLQIGGPRGSTSIEAPGAWWLLIGDETALPAVGRRLEEMASGTRVMTLMAVAGTEDEQQFTTGADLQAQWIHRPGKEAANPAPLLKAVSELKLPPGQGFIWIAAEAEVARGLRAYFIDTLGHSPDWIKASAYWSLNSEGHE